MAEVVLKGELHSSMGDLIEEKELLKQGFDVLVLEDRETESDYGWFDGWFQISFAALFWLAGRVYVGKDILYDLAEIQDTEIVYTREKNSDLLENTPFYMKLFSAAIFFVLVPGSIPVGMVSTKIIGASILMLGFALPPLLIRIFNSQQAKGENNRDKIIADKIAEAEERDQTVLAIIGASHVDGVKENLPEHIKPEIHPPKYSKKSKQHIKEVAFPFFEMILVLYSLYLLISWILINISRTVPTLI